MSPGWEAGCESPASARSRVSQVRGWGKADAAGGMAESTRGGVAVGRGGVAVGRREAWDQSGVAVGQLRPQNSSASASLPPRVARESASSAAALPWKANGDCALLVHDVAVAAGGSDGGGVAEPPSV